MRSLPILVASIVLTFCLLGASSCTLITQVDRSKIEEGGAAGASSDDDGGDSGGSSSN